jgi:hypothetical protein
MNDKKPKFLLFLLGVTAAVLLFAAVDTQSQKVDKHISATAMGTSTQMGRIMQIDVRITELSTAEDQQHLLEAFNENRSEGLVNALEKMSSKGRIAITGTIGYDLKYVRLFKNADGSSKVRYITDRPIAFGEHWGGTRSRDYSMTMGEFTIPKSGGKIKGTLIPAGRLLLNKEKQIEIEALQNPWDMNHIKVWK